MDLYLCEGITRQEDAYTLLAYAVRRRWGLEQLPAIARGEHKKPYFPNHPHIHFNLSHSGPVALCAVDDRAVGADIEVIRPHHHALPQRICTQWELAWLEEQSDPVFALCQLWVRKEALAKYRGTGLTVPLRSLCVPLPPAGECHEPGFYSFAARNWCACVCGHSAPSPLVTVPPEEIFR